MNVLIITRSDDNECISMVMDALKKRGGRPFRFDTDRFPTETRLVARYDGSGESLTISNDSDRIDLREVTAVWYRRANFGAKIPDSVDQQLRKASLKETSATVRGMIASINAFQLDPLPFVRQAANKQLQLQIAREIGLEVPHTLITNDPAAVRDFANACEHELVTKMLSSFAIFDGGGKENVVFTSIVRREDLDDLDGLKLCPMTFQESVPKRLELRVTIVGERVFAASIDSQSAERAQTDWRREGKQFVDQWKVHDLPHDVEEKLLQLMDRMGLNYGAIDVIVTPDGRHVFLEVNPVGEFFWLELHPGLAISEAIADVLLDKCPRREQNDLCRSRP